MKLASINVAEAEARRFLDAVEAHRARVAKGDVYEFVGFKESGALRRASLDLTRALSEMRKP
jgi:hypothetical protein